MVDAHLLVLANKQDLPNAMTPCEIMEKLELKQLKSSNRKWFIQPAVAPTGDGCFDERDMFFFFFFTCYSTVNVS